MDAERLLGALVQQALGGGGRGIAGRRRRRRRGSLLARSGMGGALGLGVLGIAIAAFEHYSRQQNPSAAPSFPGTTSPPPPPGSPPSAAGPPPPPPPGAAAAGDFQPPPPPPPAPGTHTAKQEEALLMVRAMIAAANADYELDDEERGRILRALDEAALDEAEKSLLRGELERPWDIAALVAAATTPELRRDVYVAAELAIEADTRAEQAYLARLAKELGLDDAAVAELRQALDRPAAGDDEAATPSRPPG